MKKNYHQFLIIIFLLIILISSLFNSNLIITSILEYTELFLTKLFPVSFIFFILSSLLIDYGLIETISKLFHINGATFFVTLMSLVSGFPSGSKYTKELLAKELITKDYANYLIKFTHFPNPLFVLGSVNIVLNNYNISFYLLISIILSNLIIALFLKPKVKISLPNKTLSITSFPQSLQNAIFSSFKTIILIYGTSLFFYLISILLSNILSLNNYNYVILMGIFDLTKGVFSTTIISSILIRALIILIFISFGGVSIHMQVKSILFNSDIKYSSFLKGRLLATFLSIVIFLLIINWTNYINSVFLA